MAKEDEEQILGHLAQFADQVVVIVQKMADAVERFAADRYEELAKAACELDQLGEPGRRHQGSHPRPAGGGEQVPAGPGRPGPAGGVHGQHRQPGHRRRGPHLDAQVHAAPGS